MLTNTLLVSHTVGISVTSGNTLTVNTLLWDAATTITIAYGAGAVLNLNNLLTGDPVMGTVVAQYAKGVTATMKGFVWDASDPAP
ncbi:MAG: hypothetical protein HGA82_02720, partial [Anaerolineales bacterium]|nr:hypothetical protein [Anaerolineales bacterium]